MEGATGEPRLPVSALSAPHSGPAYPPQAVGAVAQTVVAVIGVRRRTQRLETPSPEVAAASLTTQHAAACGGHESGHPVSALGPRPASIATAATIHWPAACAATTHTQAMALLECPLSTAPQC